jgi:hypothetical protein
MTQSQCPVFCFFNFINLFFKILMYGSSADFNGSFWVEGKSRKTFYIIIPTKFVVFKFRFWGLGAAAARQPPLGVPLLRTVVTGRPSPKNLAKDE